MKYEIEFSKKFKKSLRKLSENDQELVADFVDRLANNETLEQKYNDHALKGNFAGFRECHIKPNLLLIYEKQDDILVLYCLNVGSHSELF